MAEKNSNPTLKSEANIGEYVSKFYNCRYKEAPFCTAACPFDFDLFDFMNKFGRGSVNAAFKPYRNAVCFPDIVSEICPGYCEAACPRKETDSAVQLKMLEKTCVAKTKRKDPRNYVVPKKKGKLAIIGAGPSGMAMAQRMTSRKYEVEIFEKSGRIGGHLWDIMSPDIFLTDIERQMMHEEYKLHLNTEITDLSELEAQGFDAIYIATGKDGNDFEVLKNAKEVDGNTWYCYSKGDLGVFAGGSLLGKDSIFAIADGLNVAYVVQGWLQTKVLDYPVTNHCTKMELIGRRWEPEDAKKPSDKITLADGTETEIYTKEEVEAEIARCLQCKCDGCQEYCDILNFYDKMPFRLKEEVVATVAEGECLLNGKPAKRLVNACTQCGLCKEVCPEDIDIGSLNMAARKILHRQGKMPFGYHQYFLNDLDFANGQFANIVKNAPAGYKQGNPGKEAKSSKYAFFPGCQMGASDPKLVSETYKIILDHEPETGLMTGCCGVPAEWSGDPERLENEIKRITDEWERLGEPVLILACASCRRVFEEYYPDIKTVFLYDMMAEWPDQYESAPAGKKYSVFDPCASRGRDELRTSVRTLAIKTGVELEALERQENETACCSFGGQGAVANPEFNKFVRERRINESENPYIVYCINCRDSFMEEGKECYHLLDMLLGRNPNKTEMPTCSDRRRNRISLKEVALCEFWGEEPAEKPEDAKVKVIISDELKKKLHADKTLESDIETVIEFCERTKRNVYDPETDIYTGYKEMGYVTFWAQYKKCEEENTFELVNAYSHRIRIDLEEVWNGKKVDLDMQ